MGNPAGRRAANGRTTYEKREHVYDSMDYVGKDLFHPARAELREPKHRAKQSHQQQKTDIKPLIDTWC
jgi:diphthamide synthase subunit DPH2